MTTKRIDRLTEFNERQARDADRSHAPIVKAWNMGRKQTPPVTHGQLAEMFGVSRQRIGYVLARARARGVRVAG